MNVSKPWSAISILSAGILIIVTLVMGVVIVAVDRSEKLSQQHWRILVLKLLPLGRTSFDTIMAEGLFSGRMHEFRFRHRDIHGAAQLFGTIFMIPTFNPSPNFPDRGSATCTRRYFLLTIDKVYYQFHIACRNHNSYHLSREIYRLQTSLLLCYLSLAPSPRTMATKHPEIVILGAGIGGLALAIGLLSHDPPVPCIVYEAASKFDAIGAGIGLGPNALKSMELMSPKFARLYDEIKVGNGRAEKVHEQFEIFPATEGFGEKEGWGGGSVGHERFTRSSAHRKALLEVMQGLIPEGTVRFAKRVIDITQSDGEVSMHFADGEVAKCDVVVGCDGIKGMTRKVVLGERWPQEIPAKYCDTYIYRGIAPMKEAREIIGDYALDAKWFMTKGKGWAMYPITKGEEVNIVAFMHDENGWAGEQAAREVSREEMLSEFEGFDRRLFKLLNVSNIICFVEDYVDNP